MGLRSVPRSWPWVMGNTCLPIKAETRKAMGKEAGQIVKVHLEERR